MEKVANFLFTDMVEFLENSYGTEERGSTLYILPDSVAVSQAGEHLLEKYGVVDMSVFTTFEDLAVRIVGSSTELKPVIIPQHIRRLMARQILDEINGRGDSLPSVDTGFADALLDEFDSVWPNVIHAGSEWWRLLEASPDEGSEVRTRAALMCAFTELYSTRLSTLGNKGVYDRVTLSHEAAGHAGILKNHGYKRVIVMDLVFADSVLLELLHALSAAADLTLVFSSSDRGRHSVDTMVRLLAVGGQLDLGDFKEPVPPSAGIFGAPDRRREIEEVSRRILKEMDEEGAVPGDFAIVARSIDDYEQIGTEVMQQYGLRAGAGRRRLRDLRLLSLLMRFIDVLDGTLSKGRVIRLLEHDFFPVAELELEELKESTVHLPENLDRSAHKGYFSRISMPGSTSFWDWLNKEREKANGMKSIDAWVDISLKLLAAASQGILDDEEYRGNTRLVEALMDLASMSGVAELSTGGRTYSLRQFREILADMANGTYYQSAEQAQDGPLFTDAGLIYFRKFKHVFAVGMNENVFPTTQREGMFLRLGMADSVSRAGTPVRSSAEVINSLEGHTYERLLESSARITFSYVYSDERGRRLLPSTFVLQTMERQFGRENLLENIEDSNVKASTFFPEDGNAWTVGEVERIRAAAISEGADDSAMMKKIDQSAVTDFSWILERRAVADAEKLEWRFESDRLKAQVERKILSATDLTEYSKCPFRYVARRVLSVNPWTPPLDPLDRGLQMHEILRRFYSDHTLGFVRTAESKAVLGRMELCADNYFSEKYGNAGGVGLRFAIHMSDVKTSLLEFMRHEIESESRMHGEIVGLEQKFGFNEQKEFRIGQHRFRGVIDRIETVDGEEGRVIVYDYKSGSPDGLTKKYFRGGSEPLDFGIPLYALYLADVEKRKLAGAFYYMLLKSPGIPDRAGLVRRSDLGRLFGIQERRRSYFSIKDEGEFNDELGCFRKEISALSDSICSCNFPIEPRDGECTYCQYISLCRYRGGRA